MAVSDEAREGTGTTTPRGSMSVGRLNWDTWPKYAAATLGFRGYWYPVMLSRELGKKPVGITLLGEPIMLMRDNGKPYALHDRCLHRGVPISLGADRFGRATEATQWFPGTISCGYHGWTYELSSGTMVAALSDGPESAINYRVRVRTYPVEDRIGLVWVYVGDADPPPPVEEDIAEELLEQPWAGGGVIKVREGNWRFAAENGHDEGHSRYLHRNTVYSLFRQSPCWTEGHVEISPDGKWLTRLRDKTHVFGDFPGLGTWPPKNPLAQKGRGLSTGVSMRLPGALRVDYGSFLHYEWYVPVDADHHRYVELAVQFSTGLQALKFKAAYWTWLRWVFHGLFTDQDAVMVRRIEAPPERLYRPDFAIIAWRKFCENTRGTPQTVSTLHTPNPGDLQPPTD